MKAASAIMRAVHGLEAQYPDCLVTLVTAEGEFLYMSPRKIIPDGYDHKEPVGNSFTKFVHPDDVAKLYQSMQEALVSGESFVTKLRVRTPGGRYQWIRGFSKRLVDERTGEYYLANITSLAGQD